MQDFEIIEDGEFSTIVKTLKKGKYSGYTVKIVFLSKYKERIEKYKLNRISISVVEESIYPTFYYFNENIKEVIVNYNAFSLLTGRILGLEEDISYYSNGVKSIIYDDSKEIFIDYSKAFSEMVEEDLRGDIISKAKKKNCFDLELPRNFSLSMKKNGKLCITFSLSVNPYTLEKKIFTKSKMLNKATQDEIDEFCKDLIPLRDKVRERLHNKSYIKV